MTDISIYHTEDLDRDFTLVVRKPEFKTVKVPTEDQTQPIVIADASFKASLRFDAKVIEAKTTIADALGARVNVFVDSSQLVEFRGQKGIWELLMTKDGVTKRMIGGKIEVHLGADFQ
jgi:hypothetical protein